jgi:hypothetical protein
VTKDEIKETLFEALGIGDREWSRALGRASFEILFARVAAELRAGRDVVAEANFDGASAAGFGTLPPARIVQVHCSAPPELLLQRYRRRTRHAGHLDDEILDDVRVAIARGRHAPLPLGGELVRLDTSAPVDAAALRAQVATVRAL